uniref:GLGB n=1 Tax=Arundo donax TaxID=35708 RepID=A0A0A9RJ75_ARUDO
MMVQLCIVNGHQLHRKHSLLVTLMSGMVQTTRWREINLVFGQLRFPMSMGNLPSLTIPGLNFALYMGMEYGLIGFLHGFAMQLLMPLNLELPTMVFIGILQLVKGMCLSILGLQSLMLHVSMKLMWG